MTVGNMRFTRVAETDHIECAPYYVPAGWNAVFNVPQTGAHEVAVSTDGLLVELVRFGIRRLFASSPFSRSQTIVRPRP
jgi:hypothetical protein